jgi:hypothetical protein
MPSTNRNRNRNRRRNRRRQRDPRTRRSRGRSQAIHPTHLGNQPPVDMHELDDLDDDLPVIHMVDVVSLYEGPLPYKDRPIFYYPQADPNAPFVGESFWIHQPPVNMRVDTTPLFYYVPVDPHGSFDGELMIDVMPTGWPLPYRTLGDYEIVRQWPDFVHDVPWRGRMYPSSPKLSLSAYGEAMLQADFCKSAQWWHKIGDFDWHWWNLNYTTRPQRVKDIFKFLIQKPWMWDRDPKHKHP